MKKLVELLIERDIAFRSIKWSRKRGFFDWNWRGYADIPLIKSLLLAFLFSSKIFEFFFFDKCILGDFLLDLFSDCLLRFLDLHRDMCKGLIFIL